MTRGVAAPLSWGEARETSADAAMVTVKSTWSEEPPLPVVGLDGLVDAPLLDMALMMRWVPRDFGER
jgi:hypothetical protein